MTYNEKKSLYESIIKDVAKIVKRRLNEDFLPSYTDGEDERFEDAEEFEDDEDQIMDFVKINTKYGELEASLIGSNNGYRRIDVWSPVGNNIFSIEDDDMDLYKRGLNISEYDDLSSLSPSELDKLKKYLEHHIEVLRDGIDEEVESDPYCNTPTKIARKKRYLRTLYFW